MIIKWSSHNRATTDINPVIFALALASLTSVGLSSSSTSVNKFSELSTLTNVPHAFKILYSLPYKTARMLNQLSIPLLSYLKLAFACIVAMIALFPQQSTACTSLVLQTTSFGQIYGRTMEFGQNLYSKVVVIPRAYTFYGITPNVKVGMVWKNKYAMVSVEF